MPVLIIRSGIPCYIEAHGGLYYCSSCEPVVMSCPEGGEAVFKAWGAGSDPGKIFIPTLFGFKARKDYGGGGAGEAISVFGCDAIVWGDTIELLVKPRTIFDTGECAKSLASAPFVYKGMAAEAELLCDGRMMLAVRPAKTAEAFSLTLGRADEGRLGQYDTGRSRLLTISLKGSVLSPGDGKQRLIILNENAEAILDVVGDEAAVVEGYPQKRELIGRHSLLFATQKYRYEKGKFVSKGIIRSIGSKENGQTDSAESVALSFTEFVQWGEFQSARGLMTEELSSRLDDNDISEFFGEFNRIESYPALNHYEENDIQRCTIGIFNDGSQCFENGPCLAFEERNGRVFNPTVITYTLSNGKITDVEICE